MGNITRVTPFVIRDLLLSAEEGSVIIKQGGVLVFTKDLEDVYLLGGSIDDVTIGQAVAASGRFTTLAATGNTTIGGTLSVSGNATFNGISNFQELNSASLTGMTAYFAMNTAPVGWLKANGAAVSRTAYANLFAKIGTVWGAGNGTTTFNLPDLRAEFIRGWDDGRGVDSGRVFGSLQTAFYGGLDRVKHQNNASGGASGDETITVPTDGTFSRPMHTGESGSGNQEYLLFANHPQQNVRPRNRAMLACIKY